MKIRISYCIACYTLLVAFFIACGIQGGSSDSNSSNDVLRQTPLNDSGILWSGNANSGNNTSCTVAITDNDGDLIPQDCNQGRDALDSIRKTGSGTASFDFTKLNTDGTISSIQNQVWDDNGNQAAGTRWGCVQDNHTNLIWEVKTDDGGLHDKDDSYTWYSTVSSENGGKSGDQGNVAICAAYNADDEASYCNTQAFVARVNAERLCGRSNWRLPNVNELYSLIVFGVTSPAIDSAYFPNTVSTAFWSASLLARDVDYVWRVAFQGSDTFSNRSANQAVRLVSSR